MVDGRSFQRSLFSIVERSFCTIVGQSLVTMVERSLLRSLNDGWTMPFYDRWTIPCYDRYNDPVYGRWTLALTLLWFWNDRLLRSLNDHLLRSLSDLFLRSLNVERSFFTILFAIVEQSLFVVAERSFLSIPFCDRWTTVYTYPFFTIVWRLFFNDGFLGSLNDRFYRSFSTIAFNDPFLFFAERSFLSILFHYPFLRSLADRNPAILFSRSLAGRFLTIPFFGRWLIVF